MNQQHKINLILNIYGLTDYEILIVEETEWTGDKAVLIKKEGEITEDDFDFGVFKKGEEWELIYFKESSGSWTEPPDRWDEQESLDAENIYDAAQEMCEWVLKEEYIYFIEQFEP